MITETLHCGDNLEYMRSLPTESIDLIYSDILYGTGRNFGDYQDIKADRKTVEAFYIPRITEMHRLLKKTGSIYLQMDTRINHYIRLILEDIFGVGNFRNEIVWWYYNSQSNTKKNYKDKHDCILWYSKTKDYTYNFNAISLDFTDKQKKRFSKTDKKGKYYNNVAQNGAKIKVYFDENKKINIDNVWDIPIIQKSEYATQKPLALMERIIKASSNEGDTIADFFCGSGSFGVAGKKLNRNIILCDLNPNAIEISKTRLLEVTDLFNSK